MGIHGMYRFIEKYNDVKYVSENGIIGAVIKSGLPIENEYEPITKTKVPMNMNEHLFLNEKISFVFGSEDKGIRDLVKKSSDHVLKIPILTIESLNIS